MRTLSKDEIRCQGWAERKRLAKPLANEEAMGKISPFVSLMYEYGESKIGYLVGPKV